MVEAVGHADGGLDPVVGRLEPGVGVSEPDGSEGVGPASPDFPGEFDPPAAEILMTPTAHAAATVVPGTPPVAPGASGHAPAWTHPDLEHGFGTQWGIDDARVLDHHVFDVEKLVEYAVRQALAGCVFSWAMNILPKKRSSLTPTTVQQRTTTHENNNSAKNERTNGGARKHDQVRADQTIR